jgi:hypothetical protein
MVHDRRFGAGESSWRSALVSARRRILLRRPPTSVTGIEINDDQIAEARLSRHGPWANGHTRS